MAYWEAMATLEDGSEVRFTREYNADGNYYLEEEEQYNIECELLCKASDVGIVTFYTVNLILEEA